MIAHLAGLTASKELVMVQVTAEGKLSIDTSALETVLGNILVKVSNTQPREVAQSIYWAIGAVTAGTTVYSQVVDLGATAHAPLAGMAVKIADVAATNGEELEVEWSVDAIKWYPCPVSEIGSSRTSLVVASNADKSLISRAVLLGRYLRVRFKAATGGSHATSAAYFAWTYTT